MKGCVRVCVYVCVCGGGVCDVVYYCIEHIMYRTLPPPHTPRTRAACARAYCCLCALFAKASFMPLVASSASLRSEPRKNGVSNFHGHFKTMLPV